MKTSCLKGNQIFKEGYASINIYFKLLLLFPQRQCLFTLINVNLTAGANKRLLMKDYAIQILPQFVF